MGMWMYTSVNQVHGDGEWAGAAPAVWEEPIARVGGPPGAAPRAVEKVSPAWSKIYARVAGRASARLESEIFAPVEDLKTVRAI
jgi:hypothetical protein